jgi:hypothetical protein
VVCTRPYRGRGQRAARSAMAGWLLNKVVALNFNFISVFLFSLGFRSNRVIALGFVSAFLFALGFGFVGSEVGILCFALARIGAEVSAMGIENFVGSD